MKLLTIKQVCELVPLSRSTIYKLVAEGRLKGITASGKPGRGAKILVTRESLDAWLSGGQPAAPMPPAGKFEPVSDEVIKYHQKVMAKADEYRRRRRIV